MNCPRCRSENPADAKFRIQCGVKIELACPNCGDPERDALRILRSRSLGFKIFGQNGIDPAIAQILYKKLECDQRVSCIAAVGIFFYQMELT